MKYIILYGMCVIAQMLLFTGCEDKEQASPYLALDKDELNQSFAAAASTKEITLFSNLEVTTGISPAEATAWCRFSLKNVTEDESVLDGCFALAEKYSKARKKSDYNSHCS